MRTSYEEKLAGKEWSTIRFCFRWNFQSANAKEINAAIAKGQLISKQNFKPYLLPKNELRISALEVYYFKVSTKESLSSCKKNIDSLFVLTLK